MSGMGPGGFGLPPAGYYVVPAQGPTYLVSTVDAFGQQRWSVGVPVQQPTPRVMVLQPQPQHYVKIVGSGPQMEMLKQALMNGRPVRFEVVPPAMQVQVAQPAIGQVQYTGSGPSVSDLSDPPPPTTEPTISDLGEVQAAPEEKVVEANATKNQPSFTPRSSDSSENAYDSSKDYHGPADDTSYESDAEEPTPPPEVKEIAVQAGAVEGTIAPWSPTPEEEERGRRDLELSVNLLKALKFEFNDDRSVIIPPENAKHQEWATYNLERLMNYAQSCGENSLYDAARAACSKLKD